MTGKDELYGYGCPNFEHITISDIDKKPPEFKEITYENENWEILKQAKIVAADNIRISAWAVTKNENGPENEEWQVLEEVSPNLDVTKDITENGAYYIWIKDSAENTSMEKIQVDKVDNTPPEIAYTINKDTLSQGYVTINVTAEDKESGLYDSPFSWDKSIWSQENASRTIKENGRYKVYAEDNLGNIAELEILVDCFPQEGRFDLGDGNIIKDIKVSADWTGDTNNNVTITLNKDLDITGWQITNASYAPNDFVQVEQNVAQNNNSSNNNNNNQPESILPNNVVVNTNQDTNQTNTTNETEEQESNEPVVMPRTEPIIITTSLDINKTYYLWIKDSNGNTSCQTFTISKALI